MDPQEFIQVALGQKYKDLPFNDRYGDWPEDERANAIRRALDEFLSEEKPPAGFDVVDPNQRGIGVRHPSGFYLLKGI